ncbi:hypothetical protein Y032_0363g3542 [Ancylostoma ceylanicum]|uniref:Uncharacterized protein n=1 Tax=Ancylostoma ceylanicum TaxID=53326 RepID=A0A016RWD1_9BILA|nr:hypothetical protein Y032_0363g3542 [Ancylostoma ceylanicum]
MLSGCLQVKASLALYFSISCPLCKGIHVVVMLPQSAPREVGETEPISYLLCVTLSFDFFPRTVLIFCLDSRKEAAFSMLMVFPCFLRSMMLHDVVFLQEALRFCRSKPVEQI